MKCCLSSSGWKTRPAQGEPARPVASLATVAAMPSARRRHANVRAVGRRPRNLGLPDAERAGRRAGHNDLRRPMGEVGTVSGGVFEHSTSEAEGPVTWEALASPRRHAGLAESRIRPRPGGPCRGELLEGPRCNALTL
jgi:hypothetical protein